MKLFRVFSIMILSILLIFSCAKEAVEEEPVTEPSVQQQEEEVEAVEPVQTETSTTSEDVTLTQEQEELEEVLGVVSDDDSIDIFYMVKPNDWLSKIAKREYGKIDMWKTIYKWNRIDVGANPDLIYPFNEFVLKKEKENAEPVEYDFYNYRVNGKESLWSIAGKEYDSNYAWIVILRDNAATIGSDINNIEKGTVLKIRTQLF